MANLLADRTGAAGSPARRLLLAVALAIAAAACRGDAEPEGGGTAADTAAVVQDALAADTCTGPPPAFAQAVLNGSWQGLIDSLNAYAVTFPDIQGNDDTTSVALCATCGAVEVEIRSSNLTPCLQPGDLRGQSRILGAFILLETFPAQAGWDTIPAGDTIFTFARTPGGNAQLAYRRGDRVKTAPSTAWRFWYCQDGHTNPKVPRAQWRDIPLATTPPGQEKEVEEDTRQYGWMACASGCCQFYASPPGDPSPEPGGPDAPGVGGNPRWCPTRP